MVELFLIICSFKSCKWRMNRISAKFIVETWCPCFLKTKRPDMFLVIAQINFRKLAIMRKQKGRQKYKQQRAAIRSINTARTIGQIRLHFYTKFWQEHILFHWKFYKLCRIRSQLGNRLAQIFPRYEHQPTEKTLPRRFEGWCWVVQR